jgi:spermidine synthase
MKRRLAFIVFISGAVVMILELVGSRVVAPHLGSSTFVWTSLIGTVLGALSLGYYLGGHYADRSPSYQKLGWILFAAAISVLLTTLSKDILALIVRGNIEDLRLASIVTSIFLFGPTSILLGMVSPYCIRLAMKDLDHSGATVGKLYAISTAGSILGTFLGGFWLISLLGTTLILYTLSIVLLILSLVAGRTAIIIPVGVLLTLLVNLVFDHSSSSASKNVIDLDTEYQRVWLVNSSEGNRAVRMLATGPYGYQSGMFLDTREPTSGYLSTFATVIDGFQQRKDILAIGGAGIILPRRLAERYPQSSIHVVELDPGMTSVARNFFGLTNLPNLTIEHVDGRIFLNRTNKMFDVITLDAFTGCISIPFHLISEEALREVARLLKPRGIILQNVIGALEGDASIITRHVVRTFQQAFSHVSVYPVDPQMPAYEVQNLAVVASHHSISELSGLSNKWDHRDIDSLQPFTDDYAPLDYQMLAVYKALQN